MEVRDIIKDAVLIAEEDTLKDAVTAMIKRKTNTLLVVGKGGILVGEVSVSDLLDAVIPDNLNGDQVINHFKDENKFMEAVKNSSDFLVTDFMSTDFTPVTVQDNLITIAANAIGFRRARIPVIDTDGRPIGIISRQGLKQILAKTLGVKID